MFTKVQKVYFGHIDHAGIVYHPHFIDYFHQAYEDFMEGLGFEEKHLAEDLGARMPVVNVHVDYRSPVRSGDRLQIECVVERIGTTSIRFHFHAREQATTRSVAEGTVTRVCIDESFSSIPVPAALREALAPHVLKEPA